MFSRLTQFLSSTKSDIYSLGLILWELRSRQISFSEHFAHFMADTVIKAHVIEGSRPLLKFHDQYDQLCEYCWAPNPETRPSSAKVCNQLRIMAPPALAAYLPETNLSSNDKKWGGCLKKECLLSVKMPREDKSSRSNRIYCMVLADRFLWVGCNSGTIGVYDIESNDPNYPLFASDHCFPHGKSYIRAIAYNPMKNEIWIASDNSLIQVSFILI
jgi:hypothetical protein